MEHHEFIKIAGKSYFTVYFNPNQSGQLCSFKNFECNNKIGIIFCQSLLEERNSSLAVVTNFCRYLASQGIHALVFDYYGSGDSSGDSNELTFYSCMEDIVAITNYFKKISKLQICGLAGLRLGASLAILASLQTQNINFLVMWEPIWDLRKYLYLILKINLELQMISFNKIIISRKENIKKIKNGHLLFGIGGYYPSINFLKQIISFDPKKQIEFLNIPALIIKFSKDNYSLSSNKNKTIRKFINRNKSNSVVEIPCYPIWRFTGKYTTILPDVFNESYAWIKKTGVQDWNDVSPYPMVSPLSME